MAVCLLHGSGTVQDCTNDVCDGVPRSPVCPRPDRLLKENCVDVDSRYMPRKLIRSVSSKLRRWCNRVELDVEKFGSGNGNYQAEEDESWSVEQTFTEIVGNPGEPRLDVDAKENDKRNVRGCFGLQGILPRVTYFEKDDANEVSPSGTHENDVLGGEDRNRDEGAGWLGRRRSPFGEHLGNVEGADSGKDKPREPLKEIVMANQAQLAVNQLSDDRPSGRQKCGCFANSRIERLRDRGSSKGERCPRELSKTESDHAKWSREHPGLPDDLLEMCLARTPFITLTRARLVCRKWKVLTMSSHFLAIREKFCTRKPWLLLFGLSKDSISTGQIHAWDPTSDSWHSIRTDMLSGRLLFSVASLNSLVYVIGGCSSLPNRNGRPDKSTVKMLKAVLAYNPVTGSWKKVSSMGTARAMAVTGVFETRHGQVVRSISSRSFGSCRYEEFERRWKACNTIECNNSGMLGNISCHREEQGMHEDGRLAARGSDISSVLFHTDQLPTRCDICALGEIRHECDRSSNDTDGYKLIVVGGHDTCNEPLFSAEVYDPSTNTWRDIAKLPAEHGITCAGVVCNGLFYAYSETDKLAAYDFDLNLWTSIQVTNNLTRLHEYIPKLVTCNGKVFLLGVAWGDREGENTSGGDGSRLEKAIRMLWELNPSSQSWLEISMHPDAPLDWNAVFVSEGDQIFGIEMFKIFGQVLDFVTVCDLSGSQVTWKRVSRLGVTNDVDVSSCISKSAVVVQL